MNTLKGELPSDNPLENFPYWGSPDGKNLTAVGCLEWLLKYIEIMNEQLPCPENKDTLWHLNMVLNAQRDRMRRRTEQGVLGTNKSHKFTTETIPEVG